MASSIRLRQSLRSFFLILTVTVLGLLGHAVNSSLAHSPEIYGVHELHGHFLVNGVDALGNEYRGEVTILTAGDKLLVHWSIGTQTIKGQGRVEGDRLVVHANFGRHGPTVFKIENHDLLIGSWDEGKARENLTRRNFRIPHEGQVQSLN